MFTCVECGFTFAEPQVFCDTHGLDSPDYEYYKGCPECGEAYVDGIQCSICGEYITDDYIQIVDGQNVCDDCYTDRSIVD